MGIAVAWGFLFPALRIGVAASLVGAMVAELPTAAMAGLEHLVLRRRRQA